MEQQKLDVCGYLMGSCVGYPNLEQESRLYSRPYNSPFYNVVRMSQVCAPCVRKGQKPTRIGVVNVPNIDRLPTIVCYLSLPLSATASAR